MLLHFVMFVCVLSSGQKNSGFTVCAELRTKKTLEIFGFRDFVVLGQIKRCFLVVWGVF